MAWEIKTLTISRMDAWACERQHLPAGSFSGTVELQHDEGTELQMGLSSDACEVILAACLGQITDIAAVHGHQMQTQKIVPSLRLLGVKADE